MGKGRKTSTSSSEAPLRDSDRIADRRRVQVALDDIAASAREGLLAVAVGAGLQVMQALMEDDVTAVCGPKGRHDPDRTATRWGHEPGSASLGGRRVPVSRPRMRATDGSWGVPMPAHASFNAPATVVGPLQSRRSDR